MSHSHTTSSTFTRTDAEYIASKVSADLGAMMEYYGQPSKSEIDEYFGEMTELLVEDCLESVEYGFKRNDQRVVTLYYQVRPDGSLSDEKSGRVYAKADISNAAWFSFLTYSSKWDSLPDVAKQEIKSRISIKRVPGYAPQNGNGYWVADKSYTLQGAGTQRRTFRPH